MWWRAAKRERRTRSRVLFTTNLAIPCTARGATRATAAVTRCAMALTKATLATFAQAICGFSLAMVLAWNSPADCPLRTARAAAIPVCKAIDVPSPV